MWPGPKTRPPTPDRQQRDIGRLDLDHFVVHVGVAGEVHTPVALHHVTQGWAGRTQRRALAAVLGFHHVDGDLIDVNDVAHVNLIDAGEAEAGDDRAHPSRHDHAGRSIEQSQRRRVEVIVVTVADDDRVEASLERAQVDRCAAQHAGHALAQDGVGQDLEPARLDQDRRVAEVRQPRS